MQEFVNGIYFDGFSSKPYDVSVGFNSDSNSIVFLSNEVKETEWSFNDIVVDRVGNRINIRHIHQVQKILIIDNAEFKETFFNHFKPKGGTGIYNRLIKTGSLFHVSVAIFLIGLITLAYFNFIPWLSEKAVNVLPVSYDIALGKSVYENIILLETIDSNRTKAMKSFAEKINFNTSDNLNFTVIKSKEVNAFALPDGNIIIYTGILSKINSYSQLAALLSHEAAHVTNRHSMRALCRSVSGFLIISIITSDINGIMAVLADNANKINNLSYSRSFEREADKQGFEILVKNKIDPHAMSELFDTLKKSEGKQMPEFLSTHPLTNDRINQVKKLLENKNYSFQNNEKLELEFELIRMD